METSEIDDLNQKGAYPAVTPASSAWNTPSNALPAPSNVSFGPQYPNTLALWHNPHCIGPLSGPQGFPTQTHTPQRAAEQKKHKRTKSGCFTCRARRVKCDETRPICERCSKGKRECTYPATSVLRKDSQSNLKTGEKYPSIPECELEENEADEVFKETQKTKDAPRQGTFLSQKQSLTRRKIRQSFEKTPNPHNPTGKSPSPDTINPATESPSPVPCPDVEFYLQPSSQLADFPGLKSDVSFFVAYRKQNINYHHYMLKSHTAKFLNEDMMKYAMGYEPLLFAIVAFSAYHYSIAHPNGKIYTFLQYYNKSVSLLLKSLQGGEKHDDAMLLTILQLTTLEEFVGDWVNLIDHHQAAYRMLLELYTPESIHVDDFHRHILLWYARYDVMAGLMSGRSLVLSREWYTADEEFSMQDSVNNPDDLNKKVMAWGARTRRFALDMASLVAKMSHGLITIEQFMIEKEIIDDSLEKQRQFLESMKDPRYLVLSYPHQKPLGPGEVFDPYEPGIIYGDELWDVNFCAMELVTTTILFKYQTGLILHNLDYSELKQMAMGQCQRIETLDRWPHPVEGMRLLFMSPLGMVGFFLPQEEEYIMWCRRKLALMEQLGYVYPPSFRAKMADLWKTPSINHWWLPNDEAYPKIVREIRAWTTERVIDPRDTFREAVRDIKAVLGTMSLEDSSTPGSSPSVNSTACTEQSPGQTPEEQPKR